MLPFHEIHAMSETVDRDWCSPVADAAAAAWGHAPRAARWWRSSASHVFVLPGTPTTARAYLRLTPAARTSAERVRTVARLTTVLAGRGVRAAVPLPSTRGALVEEVDTALGPMLVTCVVAAPGEPVGLAGLTAERARAWGGALAALHAAAAGAEASDGAGLPSLLEQVDDAVAALATDRVAVDAARAVRAELATLPRTGRGYGLVHGDLELDNLAWEGDVPTSFDHDEAGWSWYVADLAYAVRDLTEGGRPRPGRAPLLDAVVGGYLEMRPVLEADLPLLPLFARAHAAVCLAEVQAALEGAEPLDEAVLPELRRDLATLADHHRTELLGGSAA
ncbi:phosphotransferase enzyme family protein [Cellulomonas sp. NS3]|uniref:phosphotransferase enzyme family protein n=1 Tax=Cellulomonas sp. NS3 TaxID=2973977 RepID=UPI0021618A6C|nr:phosphotransferase [Cellulomonas sp. NS3]